MTGASVTIALAASGVAIAVGSGVWALSAGGVAEFAGSTEEGGEAVDKFHLDLSSRWCNGQLYNGRHIR